MAGFQDEVGMTLESRELDADLHRLAHTYFEILQRLANGFSVLKTAK